MRYVFMRYPEGKYKAVTFSYDDGVVQDERLAKVFDKYGMKATFNFNCDALRPSHYTDEQINEFFLSKGHEIAVHGELHRANGTLRKIEGIKEVLSCRLELEEKCKRIIRGMAYPDSGIARINNAESYENIRNYLKDLDIAYSRTLGGDNNSFELPNDFYAWMPSAHHNNVKIFDYIDEFINLDSSTKTYLPLRSPKLFYIWGHSYEFDNNNNWDRIEDICEKLGGKEDIWYATNIEICEYVEAYKSLKYSADGRRVYNPTVTKLWFDVDGKPYSINPGETIYIED